MLKYVFLLPIILLSNIIIAQTTCTVMSYNIRLDYYGDGDNRWGLRKDRVAGLINYHEPDFVGLQEVLFNQLNYLKDSSLTGYNYIGVGRDDGKQAGEYSCIFYKTQNYTLVTSGTFWLSPTTDVPSKGWDAALNRICTYGLFKHRKTKQMIWVFNTHFDHVGRQARAESAKLIFNKIQTINTKNYPVILTGDFNSQPSDEPASYLINNMQYARSNSKLIVGNADTWNAFKFLVEPKGCIDYIFISKDQRVTVDKYITITDSYNLKYPSDHFPVMATLTITK